MSTLLTSSRTVQSTPITWCDFADAHRNCEREVETFQKDAIAELSDDLMVCNTRAEAVHQFKLMWARIEEQRRNVMER